MGPPSYEHLYGNTLCITTLIMPKDKHGGFAMHLHHKPKGDLVVTHRAVTQKGKMEFQELAPNILVTPLWPFVKPATLDWFVLIVSSSRSLLGAPSEPSLLRPLHPLSEEELFGGDGTGEEDDWKPLSELSL